MNEILNFNCNYNRKLCLQYFTTIRTKTTVMEKSLKIGSFVDIALKRNVLFSAKIISFEDICLYELSLSQKTLLCLDTGLCLKQAVDMLKAGMKSNNLVVLTLCKVEAEDVECDDYLPW